MPSRHILELEMRERSNKLFNNSPKIHESHLFQSKFSVDLLDDEPRISLHPESMYSCIRQEMSAMIRASYSTLLLGKGTRA